MKILLTLIFGFILWGCASIPPQAIELNKNVSTGIDALEENAIEMVNAWEQSGFMILDESWDKLYDKAESDYRTKKGITTGTSLTADQTKDVAGLAVLIRDEVRKKITDEAISYRSIIKNNATEITQANDSITGLLQEANRAIGKRQVVMDQVQGILPIPPNLTSFIKTTLDNI